MEKTIVLSTGKEVIIKEVCYLDAAEIEGNTKREKLVGMFKISTNLTDEDINSLNIRDGSLVEKTIAEVNGLKTDSLDFQIPAEKKE
jgi:hypothetical protein